MDALADIKQTFFQECEEQLAELESGLLAMESGETDSETINAVFRAVHSIKGGAGAFSLEALIRFAHVFETALDEMRSGRLEPSSDALKIMLRAADVLADLVRAARDGDEAEDAHSQALAEELRALSGGAADAADGGEEDWGDFTFQPVGVAAAPAAEASTSDAPGQWRVSFKPRADLYAKANETALLLRELARLGPTEVELDASALPTLADLDPEAAYLAWTVILTADVDESAVREVFEFVDGDCDLEISRIADGSAVEPDAAPDAGPELDIAALLMKAQAAADAPVASIEAPAIVAPPPESKPSASPVAANAPPPASAPAPAAGATIRVDLERVDRLIDLVGELVINQAMLSQRVMEAGLARASPSAWTSWNS